MAVAQRVEERHVEVSQAECLAHRHMTPTGKNEDQRTPSNTNTNRVSFEVVAVVVVSATVAVVFVAVAEVVPEVAGDNFVVVATSVLVVDSEVVDSVVVDSEVAVVVAEGSITVQRGWLHQQPNLPLQLAPRNGGQIHPTPHFRLKVKSVGPAAQTNTFDDYARNGLVVASCVVTMDTSADIARTIAEARGRGWEKQLLAQPSNRSTNCTSHHLQRNLDKNRIGRSALIPAGIIKTTLGPRTRRRPEGLEGGRLGRRWNGVELSPATGSPSLLMQRLGRREPEARPSASAGSWCDVWPRCTGGVSFNNCFSGFSRFCCYAAHARKLDARRSWQDQLWTPSGKGDTGMHRGGLGRKEDRCWRLQGSTSGHTRDGSHK